MAQIEATFVQGDTGPDVEATLHEEGNVDAPIDLTNATVKFQMRRPDDELFTVNAAADIISALQGQVAYSWGATDLGISGDYDAQWEVTFPDGKKQTTAIANRILVRRK
jgi:hypothetical protein